LSAITIFGDSKTALDHLAVKNFFKIENIKRMYLLFGAANTKLIFSQGKDRRVKFEPICLT